MSAPADRNLLFGILALQLEFITRDQLVAAMHAWVLDKGKPLGQILEELGALSRGDRALLEPMVDRHVERHGGDPAQSLEALSSAGGAPEALGPIDDPDLQASLGHVAGIPTDFMGSPPPRPFQMSDSTASWSAGESTSAGTRFRVLRPHARGGQGEVYVARDEELGREVALKQIQTPFADLSRSRERFVLEAEITGCLEHPGIVSVYGLGKYPDGRPFYAMRFIQGDSLKDAIRKFHGLRQPPVRREPRGEPSPGDERTRAPGPEEQSESKPPAAEGQPQRSGPPTRLNFESREFRKLLGRFVDVCEAMSYAHSRGVLHRDLKPANVMLGKYGETLVVDWGLAKATGRHDPVASTDGLPEASLIPRSGSGVEPTVAGNAIGTPPYMSPEAALGRLDLFGKATDIYGLGAILYSVLTGHAPVEGPTERVEVLSRVSRGEIPPPRSWNSAIPPALSAVCQKAMALKPDDRYATARALADDIEHWLADEPVGAHPEGIRARLMRSLRKNPILGIWILLIVFYDVSYFAREFAAPYMSHHPDYFLYRRDIVFYPISYSIGLSQVFCVLGLIIGQFTSKGRPDAPEFVNRMGTRGVAVGAVVGAIVGFVEAIWALTSK